MGADVWSITSYKELYKDGIAVERWNMLHPAEKAKVPFMFVVGDREVQGGTLAIRGRTGANLGSMTVAGAIDLLQADIKAAGQQHSLTH